METAAEPLVSVVIITYRHAAFIRQCVESALAQRTDFPFEVLIGEDESDDGTREICLELAAAHPDRVRVLLHSRKDVVLVDGKPRGTHNLVATVAAARGEFVALTEGDDYWTDPEKLARQVAYLRTNADCVGCFHEASEVDATGQELRAENFRSQVANPLPKYDQRACLTNLMSRYPTCSLMFRTAAFRSPPDWYLRRSSDFMMDLVITQHGKLGFLDRRMAAYRRHAGGVWSSQPVVAHVVEQVMRFKHLLNDPSLRAKYEKELHAQVTFFQGLLAMRGEVTLLTQQLAQRTELINKLTAEREKLIAFLQKQHAMIQGYRQAETAVPAAEGAPASA